MSVLLTYDVDSKHVEIKNRLISNYGYTKVLVGATLSGGKPAETDLPNTTVFHATKGKADGSKDIAEVAAYFGAVLEKFLAYENAGNWQGETSRLL